MLLKQAKVDAQDGKRDSHFSLLALSVGLDEVLNSLFGISIAQHRQAFIQWIGRLVVSTCTGG